MEGLCPNCQTPLQLPTSGRYQCERCRARFEVALGSPEPPPAPAPVLSVAEALGDPAREAACPRHPQNRSTTLCERCGDFMCGLCSTRIEGRRYCPDCFEILHNRGSLAFMQKRFTLPASALWVGIIAFVGVGCALYALPMGGLGLALGLRALREVNEKPDLPGRSQAVAGLVFSTLSLLGTVVVTALVVWSLAANR